jgi:hypothetical protein
MAVEGIDYLYIETHDYAATSNFWRRLGFELTIDLGAGSGQWTGPDGFKLFIEEVPADRQVAMQLYLRVKDTDQFRGNYEPSHWGSKLLPLSDPDGRTLYLQAWDETTESTA